MIFKLESVFKDYLWGGEKLRHKYNKKTKCSPLAESWEISCHADGESIIASGSYSGKTLSSLLKDKPEWIGRKGMGFDRFPVLVKFIDAKLDLSVQVHPDDTYGLRVENEPGKTEVWYVLDAEADARLIMGFKEETSAEAVEKATEEGRVLELLNQVPVKAGDVFFIEAGTVHGIGGGITLIEIQQNSNTTYRVYDYDRVGKDGKKRPLHLEKALDVMTYSPSTLKKESLPVIASCAYFHVECHQITEPLEMPVKELSFQGITCVEGELTLRQDDETLTLVKGDSAFVTAEDASYHLDGKGQVIITSLP